MKAPRGDLLIGEHFQAALWRGGTDLFSEEILQANMSISYPWHRAGLAQA